MVPAELRGCFSDGGEKARIPQGPGRAFASAVGTRVFLEDRDDANLRPSD